MIPSHLSTPRFAKAVINSLLLLSLVVPAWGQSLISTIAGGGLPNNVPAVTAPLSGNLAADRVGNYYVSNYSMYSVFRVNAQGVLTVVAGTGGAGASGDGVRAASASLLIPTSVAVDNTGNVFIADYEQVRRVDGTTGIMTTIAGTGYCCFSGDGGPALQASLDSDLFIAVDGPGQNLYIAERDLNRIHRVVLATGIITTIAGNGSSGYSGDGGLAINASLD